MSDELIREAEQDRVSHNGTMMKIKFNRSKRANIDAFAELLFKPADGISNRNDRTEFPLRIIHPRYGKA